MGRAIITHVGTSLLNCDALIDPVTRPGQIKSVITRIERHAKDRPHEAIPGDLKDRVIGQLIAGLRVFWSVNYPEEKRRSASPAEIASLSLLHPTHDDRIVLLHSDTPLGELCSEALSAALQFQIAAEFGFPSCTPEEYRIEGLKIEETNSGSPNTSDDVFDEFIGRGLVNYATIASKEFDDLAGRPGAPDEPREFIINVTGGYKGTVPFARDIALILGQKGSQCTPPVACEICYLFQNSNRLIHYGAFPINIAYDDLPTRKLDDAQDRAGIPETAVSPADRKYFMPLRNSPGRMKASALGTLLHTLRGKLNQGGAWSKTAS